MPKEKGNLKSIKEYQSVLKHLSVRWLSLEKCISRTTLKFTSLKACFLSESFADERFQRLEEKFNNPLLEPFMLFLSSALPLFTHFNQLLQREEPTIHILKSAMESLGEKLAKRIMLPIKVKEISSISDIDLSNSENFMNTQDMYVGVLTKNVLKRKSDGVILQNKDFFDAAHYYFKSGLEYIQKKFPLDDPLIVNAAWVNVSD